MRSALAKEREQPLLLEEEVDEPLQANAIISEPILLVEASFRESFREDVPDALSILGVHWLAVAQSYSRFGRVRPPPRTTRLPARTTAQRERSS